MLAVVTARRAGTRALTHDRRAMVTFAIYPAVQNNVPGKGIMASVIVAFSVTPLGIGEGVGEVVADAVRVVRESGLPNHTDAMFTVVEGEWDEVMTVVKKAVDVVATKAPRVSIVLKADMRAGVSDAITSKVEALERYLSG